ncbi:hypothetical protein FRC11_004153 [Ceratobasidium sp. 423]|nr:hypothetical protein FRC11_004153 [Ceratobasidium sp. 423]
MEPAAPVNSASTQNLNNPRSPPMVATSPSSRRSRQVGFTNGTDMVLRSSDGLRFGAHSIILSLASSTFAYMFDIGSRSHRETIYIELAESGEMVDLMLKFIYPIQSPAIHSFDTLDKALRVATKYQFEDMRQQLRHKLSAPGSPVSVHTDPLKALAIASTHGLKDEMTLAASLAQGNHDFNTIEGLLALAESAPASIPWITVIGIPTVKSKIISEVVFSYHQYPMQTSSLPLCGGCSDHRHRSKYSPPEWEARWSHSLSTELMKRSMDDWKSCFDLAFLYEAVGRHGGTPMQTAKGTCTCLENLSVPPRINYYERETTTPVVRYLDSFSEWSNEVYEHLTTRLARLGELEGLTGQGVRGEEAG